MKSIVLLTALVAMVTVGLSVASERVTGVITKINAESNAISVRTGPNQGRTLSLTDSTVYKRGSRTVHLEDINVGETVVMTVRDKTAQIEILQVEEAPAPSRK